MHKVDGQWRPDSNSHEWECPACGWINQPGDHACVCVLQADDRERRRRALLARLDDMTPWERRRYFTDLKRWPRYMGHRAIGGVRYLALKRTARLVWWACPVRSPMNYRIEAYRVPVSARVAASIFFSRLPLRGITP